MPGPKTSARRSSCDVTALLVAMRCGDASALDRLMPLVHDELRRLARRQMRRERHGHTLQTTALVNEAYVRLIDLSRVTWQDRAHFFAMSARLMRRVLVDHARSRARAKRGAGAGRVALDAAPAAFLDAACGGDAALRREVESLLAYATAADGFLERSALEEAAGALADQRRRLLDRQIGGYRIVMQLGHGGMGEVYLARDVR